MTDIVQSLNRWPVCGLFVFARVAVLANHWPNVLAGACLAGGSVACEYGARRVKGLGE